MGPRVLCIAVWVASLVSPCLGTVIGDFEGDMEGWYVPGNPNVSLQYTTRGVTLNAVGLKVQTQAGGWQDAMALDIVAQDTLMAAFLESSVLTVDVTRFASEWQGNPQSGHNQMFMVINAGGQGWDIWDQHVAGDWTPDQGDQTSTLVFDLASARAQIDVNNLWWFEIRLAIYSDQGYAPGGTYYLDNIRLLSHRPQKVIWVSESCDMDEDDVQDDQAWVNMLRAAGHDVNVTLDRWTSLDLSKVKALNAADLVIMSRTFLGGSSATDPLGVFLWNSVKTPLIQTNANLVRSNRWNWLSGSGLVNAPAPLMLVQADDHPVFSGMDLNPAGQVEVLNGALGGEASDASFPSSGTVGSGTLLASTMSGHVWMAEWNSGVEFYEGAGQFAGGQRLTFMAGTRDVDGAAPRGDMNLTQAGQQVFLNAVAYMLQFKITDPGTDNLAHAYRFDDGTANDSAGSAHGLLIGGAQVVDGALVTGRQGDWMEMPADIIALNTFEGLTLEALYTPAVGANTGWTMLAYFGDSARVGQDYICMTSARADDKCSAAISVGNPSSSWEVECSVEGPEHDDDALHKMVVTLSDTHMALYMDGRILGMARLSESHRLAGISPAVAYLAKSGDRGGPEWMGRIHEFNIYNRALSPGEVLFLAGE
ncbi:MAG: LamG domain-containing protein [Planctomycetes bacterium]|nr:LamG domain-containing protein [Planctomycetota bacterium]